MAVSSGSLLANEPDIKIEDAKITSKFTRHEEFEQRHLDHGHRFDKLKLADIRRKLDQFTVDYEADTGSLWCSYRHVEKPCYTPKVLDQILCLQAELRHCAPGARTSGAAPRYLVWGSTMDGVFNLGGDLELFAGLIRNGDEDGLRRYAYRCVDTVYNGITNGGLPLLNISLVQGDALGGGFEAVLASDVIIAERQSKFGLPEVLFNLFPGMGAYSLLCRRLDGARAKQMILSGRLYSAQEMHDCGIVDILAEPGEGRAATRHYIERNLRRHRMLTAICDVRRRCQPVTYEELIDVTDLWVDTALNLQDADLRRMERLVAAQKRRAGKSHRGI